MMANDRIEAERLCNAYARCGIGLATTCARTFYIHGGHMNGFITRSVFAAAAAALALNVAAADKMANPADKKDARADAGFVTEAGQDGHAEVELGKLAQKNGSSGAVKDFGKRMVTDHSKAGSELAAIAKKLDIKAPGGPSDKHKATYKKLAALKGEKFDSEYAQHMVDDHEKAVSRFQKQAKSGEAKELKDFASKTLPTLEEHLKMARALKDRKK
jgi:putative membrane protein